MSNKRTEELKDNIEETESEIKNILLVVEKLEEVEDIANRIDERTEVNKLIDRFSKEIEFLEGLKESDERTLLQIA